MLILSRKVKERLVLEGEIFITVLSVKGNCVRFGIEAPKNLSVNREEIHLKIKEEQRLHSLIRQNQVFQQKTA